MAAAATTTLDTKFERKLEIVTAGLPQANSAMLRRIPQEDAMTVMDYLLSLKSEANPSVNYRRDIVKCLTKFIAFCRGTSGIS